MRLASFTAAGRNSFGIVTDAGIKDVGAALGGAVRTALASGVDLDTVAGDVIVTGTPGSVGFFHKLPLFMKDGDVIEVEITGIGTLTNPIKAEA